MVDGKGKDLLTGQPPLPRRIAWFAPWTWQRRWWWVTVCVLAFVGYPLSIGPASVLTAGGWIDSTATEYFYTPLVETAKLNNTTYRWLALYIQWCHIGT